MGWKKIKEHYGIEETVHVNPMEAALYVRHQGHDLLRVLVHKNRIQRQTLDYYSVPHAIEENLHRYEKEIWADGGKFRELFREKDVFGPSTVVYVARLSGEIAEELTEDGVVTHEGQLVQEPYCCADRAKVEAFLEEMSHGA